MAMSKRDVWRACEAAENYIRNKYPMLAPLSDPEGAMYPGEQASHVLFMCQEVRRLIDSERTEKAMRWLGFIQGFVWANSMATIPQMNADNRPANRPADAD